MLPPLQLTAVRARTAKLDPAAPEEEEEPSPGRERDSVGGALMLDAESLLHAEIRANELSAAPASPSRTSVDTRG